jgi:hypothetical protein
VHVATSTGTGVAEEFNNSGVKFEFRVPAWCMQVCQVHATLSEFQHESEVLLVPYSPIRVVEKRQDGWVVVEVARDSRGQDDSLPVTVV